VGSPQLAANHPRLAEPGNSPRLGLFLPQAIALSLDGQLQQVRADLGQDIGPRVVRYVIGQLAKIIFDGRHKL
jgi:hypothetical protein